MKRTANLTARTLFIYLALIAALVILWSHANAQQWKPNPKYIKSAKDTTGKA